MIVRRSCPIGYRSGLRTSAALLILIQIKRINVYVRTYAARSKLVYEGKHPDTRSVVDFLELLRELLPVMAVLDSEAGSHKVALARIDAAGIGDEKQ